MLPNSETTQSKLLNTTAAPPDRPEYLTPAPRVAEQLGVTRRTLSRWLIDEKLTFPRPIALNSRLYFRQSELEVWKLERARRAA